MNIAIMIPTLGGGGAERVASILGDNYAERGHKVYFFLGRDPHTRKTYDVKGKIIHTGITPFLGSDSGEIRSALRGAKKIKELKKKYKIDVAISFMEEFNYLNILSRGKEKVYVRVCTILSKHPDVSNSLLYNPYILGFFYNKADKVIVMTDYARKDMHNTYKVKKNKICIIPNPVIPNSRKPVLEKKDHEKKSILCIGRLEAVKQQNVAIKAFSVVHKEIKDARLIILGEGSFRQRIQRMVNRAGLTDSVSLPGFQKDMSSYFQNADIFLMTSVTEGFPNSMLEAMEAGIPAVSIDSPGAPGEILIKREGTPYGKYGVITPYIQDNSYNCSEIEEEERRLGEVLIHLFQNESLLIKYREAALKRAGYYHISKVMEIWDKLVLNTK